MPQRYERPEDAATRLDGSVLFYKGLPAFIRTDGFNMRAFKVANTEVLIARDSVESEDLILTSPELGYANYFNDEYPYCVYFCRAPYRRYKQGLTRENTLASNIGSSVWHRAEAGEMYCQAFEHMLLNKYPDWKGKKVQAVLESKDFRFGHPSFALSRNIAVQVTKKSNLLYIDNVLAAEQKADDEKFRLVEAFANTLVHYQITSKGIPCYEP